MTDDHLTELYFERAAIQEYDGKQTRQQATEKLFNATVAWCKKHNRTVPEAIRDDYEKVTQNEGDENGKS
jgi:hypothetical protein